jgi:hypothetical protein
LGQSRVVAEVSRLNPTTSPAASAPATTATTTPTAIAVCGELVRDPRKPPLDPAAAGAALIRHSTRSARENDG